LPKIQSNPKNGIHKKSQKMKEKNISENKLLFGPGIDLWLKISPMRTKKNTIKRKKPTKSTIDEMLVKLYP
jgi:hypothetical protein